MKETALQLLICAIVLRLLFTASMPSAVAQSQALNGQIEGTVSDQNNAAIPNATISVTNIETGATRTVAADESGVYRFPLLPLGNYRITAEAQTFKKLVREGVTLTTGQTATVDEVSGFQTCQRPLDGRAGTDPGTRHQLSLGAVEVQGADLCSFADQGAVDRVVTLNRPQELLHGLRKRASAGSGACRIAGRSLTRCCAGPDVGAEPALRCSAPRSLALPA